MSWPLSLIGIFDLLFNETTIFIYSRKGVYSERETLQIVRILFYCDEYIGKQKELELPYTTV